MPRLRNPRSGVVVDVDEVTAERLASEWEPAAQPSVVDEPQHEEDKPKRGRPRKS